MIFSTCEASEMLKTDTPLESLKSPPTPIAFHSLVRIKYIMVLYRSMSGARGYDLGMPRDNSHLGTLRSIAWLVLYWTESQTGDMRLHRIEWLANPSVSRALLLAAWILEG